MTIRHPDEATLQQYAVTGTTDDAEHRQHLMHCADCRKKIVLYALLFAEVKEQPVPSFRFNLEAVIMEKLPAKNKKIAWQPVFYTSLLLGAIAVIAYNQRFSIGSMFEGFSNMASCLVFISLLCLAAFQLVDMIRKYQRQMNALE